jgi:hypothetical protein
MQINIGLAREPGKLTVLTVGSDWNKQIEDSEAECGGRPYKVFRILPNPRALAEIRKWLMGFGDSWKESDQGAREVLKSFASQLKKLMKEKPNG